MTDAELTLARFYDRMDQAERYGIFTFTDFLNLAEQSILLSNFRSGDVTLWGGIDGCERKMARFGQESELGYSQPFAIDCICITPKNAQFAQTLAHRDVLGALLSLGIERSVLGDIFFEQNVAYVFCRSELSGYITEQLTSVRHTAVVATVTSQPPAMLVELTEQSVSLSSLRVDALVAKVFRLSREDAQRLILQKRVFINAVITEQPSRSPSEGDVISVRGLGRFVYSSASTNKKGKIVAKVQLYA